MRFVLGCILVAACAKETQKPPPPPQPQPRYQPVGDVDSLQTSKEADGREIEIVALVAPPSRLTKLYGDPLVVTDIPILHVIDGAMLASKISASSEHELYLLRGRFHASSTSMTDAGFGLLVMATLSLDEAMHLDKPLERVNLNTIDPNKFADPLHVSVDGTFHHGEERSEFDGLAWLDCPTRLPDGEGPIHVEGWLFGGRGGYGHMNRYRFHIDADRCVR